MVEERFGDAFFDEILDVLADEPSALFWGKAFLGNVFHQGNGILEHDILIRFEALDQIIHFQDGDLADSILAERVEDDRVIEACQEFRPHFFFELGEHLLLDGFELRVQSVLADIFFEADAGRLGEGSSTAIGSQDDEGVSESSRCVLRHR